VGWLDSNDSTILRWRGILPVVSFSTYIDLICASFDNSITQFSFPLQNRDLSVDYRIRSDGMQLKPPRADRLTIRILLIFSLAFAGPNSPSEAY
jgi:hypothetical protein